MTKHDLNHHLMLRKQLEKSRALLVSLEAAGLAGEAADIRDDIESLDAELQRSEAAVTAWSDTIDDLQTRMIFRLRFLRGFEWKAVAALTGGTRSSVENRAYRYLEAHHDE